MGEFDSDLSRSIAPFGPRLRRMVVLGAANLGSSRTAEVMSFVFDRVSAAEIVRKRPVMLWKIYENTGAGLTVCGSK